MMSGVSALLWQAALMLLGAYFIGAFLGCWLRRRFSAPPQVAMESPTAAHSSTARAAVSATAPSSDRFGRALDGADRTTPPPVNAATGARAPSETAARETAPAGNDDTDNAPVGATGDAAARAAASDSGAAPRASEDLRARIPPEEPPITPAAPVTAALAQVPPEEAPPAASASALQPAGPLTPPMSASAAAAAARAARLSVSNRPTPEAPQLPSTQPPRATVSTADRMEQFNPAATTDLPASSGSVGQATVAAQIETATVPVSDVLDDLTQIKGVTEADAKVLRDAGFTTFSAIADWSTADVARANASITGERRISRENWIEQAQLLKNGGTTAYTSSVLARLAPRPAGVVTASSGAPLAVAPVTQLTASDSRGEEATDQAVAPSSTDDPDTISLAEAPAPATESVAATAGDRTAAPDVSERAAFARERRGYADDLQQIDGINGEVEKLLNEQGVTRVAQIASWPPQEAQRIDRLLGSMDRIRRENWVGQARRMSGFSETEGHPTADQEVKLDAPSPVPIADEPPVQKATPSAAATPTGRTPDPTEEASGTEASESNILPLGSVPNVARNNVSKFRSVRSEALVGTPSVDPDNPGDDLKRIRGIGVLIEKRLRAMGYTSYEQIGSWTQSDVDRVNQKLDFRGRIERENWIEQARILAAGGQTEFSRRQERDDN